jgi:hypothetical protein
MIQSHSYIALQIQTQYKYVQSVKSHIVMHTYRAHIISCLHVYLLSIYEYSHNQHDNNILMIDLALISKNDNSSQI